MAPLRPLVLLAAVASFGCARSAPTAAPACPSEAFLEAVHAAAFHFEHGTAARGWQSLEQARALAPAEPGGKSREVLDRLEGAARMIDEPQAPLPADPNAAWLRPPDQARYELEKLRLEFADWACLPEPLHQRFHAALPKEC